MLKKIISTGLALAALSTASMADDHLKDGERAFKKYCAICHQIGEGAQNFTGPNLNNVVGRNAGEVEGFLYSQAMKESEIVWTEEVLKEYLANPKKMVKGSNMNFAGIRKKSEIGDLVEYLKAHS